MKEDYICKFCGKICKNANSLRNHERLCKLNPERQESSWVKFNHERGAWNKGLTKETDERLRLQGLVLSEHYASGEIVSHNKGQTMSYEQRQKLSIARKRYLKENPDKVPYILNHHSNGDSYPEKYFKAILDNEKIEYKQNYYQNGYFLDFAWPEKKLYLEIDGEQHYVDERIVEHDKVRTETLSNEGWVCVERIRWSEYQKLNETERKDYLKMVFTRLK